MLNKFHRIILLSFLINLSNVTFVNADVVINEVMYNPSTAQGDDSDLEWIEFYNTENSTVDLSDWTMDNNNFDDVNISPNGYVVVARQLIDDDDSDLDSFEAYYGNNDSVWNSTDANYIAVDGSFGTGLKNSGEIINLTNGSYTQLVDYTPFLSLANGDGYTLERIDPNKNNWTASNSINGTPGAQNSVYADITAPVITSVTNTSITNESATITWVTDDNSNSTVYYGTNASLGLIKANNSLVKTHSMALTNLTNTTIYYYNVSSCNEYGYCNISSQYNFTTLQNAINQAPNITNFYPSELNINIAEPNNQTFNITYNDPENNTINISWYLNSSLELSGIDKYEWNFSGNYSSSGFYNITVIISDNSLTNKQSWNLTINNTDRTPSIIINTTKYSRNTTDFSSLNSTQLQNIINMTLENVNNGKIIFIDNINLSSDINFNNFMDISFNKIEINSTALPMLNKSATLYFYNLTFTNPRILRNNNVCSSEICNILSYSAGDLIFNITMFSSYSAEETPSAAQSPASSGGGSTRVKKCNEVWICGEWNSCNNGLQERNCNAAVYCDGTSKPVVSRECIVKEEPEVIEETEQLETTEITGQYEASVDTEKEEKETEQSSLISGAAIAKIEEANSLVGILILFVILALGIYLYFFSGIFFERK